MLGQNVLFLSVLATRTTITVFDEFYENMAIIRACFLGKSLNKKFSQVPFSVLFKIKMNEEGEEIKEG